MKTYMKFLANAVSALALVGSMSAHAFDVDGIQFDGGPLTINGGFGKSFFSTSDIASGDLASGGSLNMGAGTLYRGGAFTIGGVTPSGNVSPGDYFYAFGEIASGFNEVLKDLSYVIKGQVTNVSAGFDANGRAFERGAFMPGMEIDFFTKPLNSVLGSASCPNTTSPAVCQGTVNSITGGSLFLKLVAVNQPPLNLQTLTQFTLTNNVVNSASVNSNQTLAFQSSFFDVVGGSAAAFFAGTGTQEISASFFADYSNSSTGTQANPPPGSIVNGFNLVLDTASVVPEPGTLALLGLALVGVGFTSRRRRQV